MTTSLSRSSWSCRGVEQFELQKQLYRGKASVLFRALCRQSGTVVALKYYRKRKLSNLNWYQARMHH